MRKMKRRSYKWTRRKRNKDKRVNPVLTKEKMKKLKEHVRKRNEMFSQSSSGTTAPKVLKDVIYLSSSSDSENDIYEIDIEDDRQAGITSSQKFAESKRKSKLSAPTFGEKTFSACNSDKLPSPEDFMNTRSRNRSKQPNDKESFPDIARKKVKKVRGHFSSPYRSRLVTEQVTVEREEINIESGKRVICIEVLERDVVDLTGSEKMSGSELECEDFQKVLIYEYIAEVNQKLAKKFKKGSNMMLKLPTGSPNLREVFKHFKETSLRWKKMGQIKKQ